jgi:antigen flippase
MPETAEVTTAAKHSYGQILKSSALLGGASVLNIAIGMVRTKAMAVFLGPAVFGLMGLYASIGDLAQTIACMGINSSGVRQIAQAVGSGEKDRIARTVTVLRRTSTLLGICGAALLAVFSRQVSTLTFGTDQYATAVAVLSVTVFLRLVSAGQGAVLQGMRRIPDLARIGVLGAFFGTIISIPMVFFLREDGVVPALVGVAATSIVASWWYSRKVSIEPPAMTASEVGQEALLLLKLGLAFMSSALLTMGAAYAVRMMISRTLGLEAAGFYQAAWTLGGLYVGFILQAMGADFYPRLAAVSTDNTDCNRLVNEQAQISLLLTGPGVIATLTLAPLVIALFYSVQFHAAEGLLRWLCLGMTLRVITWPMGFLVVAKGHPTWLFVSELAWTVANVGLSWICLKSFGLNGAGIAFFASYIVHAMITYPIVRRLSGFRWSAANRRTGLLFLSLIAMVFCGFWLLPPVLAAAVGIAALILSAVYSIRVLLTLVSLNRFPSWLRKWLALFQPRL